MTSFMGALQKGGKGLFGNPFSLLSNALNSLTLTSLSKSPLNREETERLERYRKTWDYYRGKMWQDNDSSKFIQNWCRRFVDKYVSSEFNNGFIFKFSENAEKEVIPFVNQVWEDNNGDSLMRDLGQCKSVSGDGYIHVHYEPPDGNDPFGLYPKGRIRLFSVPSNIVFPKYKDGYDCSHEALESVSIIYHIRTDTNEKKSPVEVRYIYTVDKVYTYHDNELVAEDENIFKVIPIVHFRNIVSTGSKYGRSDLADLISINDEYNDKVSDISEIITYHAAPVTVIYGARMENTVRGANKVWSGFPEKARVENLETKSNLSASTEYIKELKKSLLEIGSIPALAIGGDIPPANLSGVAFQIAFMPLLDLIKTKQVLTGESISIVNKIIVKMAIETELLKVNLSPRDLYTNYVRFGDILPKDLAQELALLQAELKMGLESRKNGMIRTGKDNIEQLILDIDKDRGENPLIYGVSPMAMGNAQRLVNPESGEVILDFPKIELNDSDNQGTSDEEMDTKRNVGYTREGKEEKVFTGLSNRNNGKEGN